MKQYVQLFESWVNEAAINPNAAKYKADMEQFIAKSKAENPKIESSFPCLVGYNKMLNDRLKKFNIYPGSIGPINPDSLKKFAINLQKSVIPWQWMSDKFTSLSGSAGTSGFDRAIYMKDNKDEIGNWVASCLAANTASLQGYVILREGVYSYLLTPEGAKYRKDMQVVKKGQGTYYTNDPFKYSKEEDPVTNFISVKDIPAEQKLNDSYTDYLTEAANNPVMNASYLNDIISDLKYRVKNNVNMASNLEEHDKKTGVGTRILNWFF